MDRSDQLTIRQTRTGYWTVQRGTVHLAGAPTRHGAEAERELLSRLKASEARPLPRTRDGRLTRSRRERPDG